MTQRLIQRLLVVLPVLLADGCSAPSAKIQRIHHGNFDQKGAAPPPSNTESIFSVKRSPGEPSRFNVLSYTPVASGVFPKPPGLEPQVAFWRNVYSVWSRSQVVLHDNRFMDLIYEVIDLPGEIKESYTPIQKALVEERKAYWEARLRDLEQKVAFGRSLTPDDRKLAQKIGSNGNLRTVLAGASERLRAQRGLRERFKRGLEISGRYDRHFREIFRRAGLPEDLAFLPHVESSFQAYARSSAGAVGVWQFTRAAAERFMNINSAIDERLDPIASAEGAARYLSYAYDKLGSWPLAITSYNHGISGMMRAKQLFGDDFMRIVSDYDHPLFGFASRNFYAEFLAAREIALQPERFFAEGIRYEKPQNWDRVVLRQNTPVSTLARYYETDTSQLIALNAAWTESAKSGRVALPAGTTVWLPPGTLQRLAQREERNRLVAQNQPILPTSPNIRVSLPDSRRTPRSTMP